ncbi:MAG: ATP-binding protein [Acholeplasmataceae bacterium]|nr:ATP-binding protein [Acholeplasmataceae bacterium]
MIHIKIIYLNPLEIYYGNFITTKKDTRYHRYGLKDTKSIFDTYDGSVSIKIDNNGFCLVIRILILRQSA